MVQMQHLPVPSQMTAVYADSETALWGLAEVFKMLTEINSNGFPGVEKVTGKQMTQVKLKQAETVLGGGHKELHLNLEQLPFKSLFKSRGLEFTRTRTD